MSTRPLRSPTPVIDIYVHLAQYPILAGHIRQRMREELFRRGLLNQQDFEEEVRAKAVESQQREGLIDPFGQEETSVWHRRRERVRDFLTDAYFADNLGSVMLHLIIAEVLTSQPTPTKTADLTFNPEIAPWELLFRQGELYENLPPEECVKVEHHLQEIKVVLIKRMISDQLPFIAVAKKVFSMADLRLIYERRIGNGKIGGKSAGMMLAWRMLQQENAGDGPDIGAAVDIADSYFIGSEVLYDFRLMNGLDHLMNQKYRPLDEIRAQYPNIVEAHLRGHFPVSIEARLHQVLQESGDSPLIVRSSSLLEDNFGFAFAGKYESYFCPNQGNDEQNLKELLDAIKRVFASTLNPDAILYRQYHGLIDYDERMGILLQRIQGKRYGRYFMPTLAGVGFSQNPFRWHPKIKREDGFLRLVFGMGTRAVDRVANDYPRMISLSHPQLRPETTAKAIRQYSQWYVDVIDLIENQFKTVPVREVLKSDYPFLRHVASINKGEYLQNILSLGSLEEGDEFVLTFDALVKDKKFVELMRTALRRLEKGYGVPVDTEFAIDIIPKYPYPEYQLHLLQCRPLSQRAEDGKVEIPQNIPTQDILFTARDLIPDGKAEGVRYIIFVNPEKYRQIPDPAIKLELGRVIGRLNKKLEHEMFILIGPGRWGSANLELGVKVTYADIFNTKILIEMAVVQDGIAPELSYGTHFFQDLVESGIHSLPLHLHQPGNRFNWQFFQAAPNSLGHLLPQDVGVSEWLQVVDISAVSLGRRLNVLMDGSADEAVGYLVSGNWGLGDDQSSVSLGVS